MIFSPSLEPWVSLRDELDIVVARRIVRELGVEQGLTPTAVEALATALTEVAQNVLVHAHSGRILVCAESTLARRGVKVVAQDDGPGIGEVGLALADGYSTADGLGLGLPSARRLVDDFSIESRLGEGTIVTLWKWSA